MLSGGGSGGGALCGDKRQESLWRGWAPPCRLKEWLTAGMERPFCLFVNALSVSCTECFYHYTPLQSGHLFWPWEMVLKVSQCVCAEKTPGLRCSMKTCGEQPLQARQGRIRGEAICGKGGHNPICLFTLQQRQIRTIDTLGVILQSKYGSRRKRRSEDGGVLQRRAARVNFPHGPLHRVQYEADKK